MKFDEWEPLYELILEDMHWERNPDDESAQTLSRLLYLRSRKNIHDVLDREVLHKIINGKDVLVCGKAPCLKDDIKNVNFKKYVVISADGATSVLMDKGIVPDIIVTDLDGNMEDEARANDLGSIMVVHAHGHNMDLLMREIPRLKMIIGTTQSTPLSNVYNFGGLSDGDRSVFLAKEMGARSITLTGFDLKDENVTPVKKKKLQWAEKLIHKILS